MYHRNKKTGPIRIIDAHYRERFGLYLWPGKYTISGGTSVFIFICWRGVSYGLLNGKSIRFVYEDIFKDWTRLHSNGYFNPYDGCVIIGYAGIRLYFLKLYRSLYIVKFLNTVKNKNHIKRYIDGSLWH